MIVLLNILGLLLILGTVWFLGGPAATINLWLENLEQITQLLIFAVLTFVGVFALMLAWAFISLRHRDKKTNLSQMGTPRP